MGRDVLLRIIQIIEFCVWEGLENLKRIYFFTSERTFWIPFHV